LDRNCACRAVGDRGLEIYRLPDATAPASKQNCDPGAGAEAVIVDLSAN
jgi:hypothetical protein